jgi:hypothetical protein
MSGLVELEPHFPLESHHLASEHFSPLQTHASPSNVPPVPSQRLETFPGLDGAGSSLQAIIPKHAPRSAIIIHLFIQVLYAMVSARIFAIELY